MNDKILSNETLHNLLEHINQFEKEILTFSDEIQTLINHLNEEEIIQIFYKTGTFGQKQQEILKVCLDAVKLYSETTVTDSGSLSNETKKYANNLIEINNSTPSGGGGPGIGPNPGINDQIVNVSTMH